MTPDEIATGQGRWRSSSSRTSSGWPSRTPTRSPRSRPARPGSPPATSGTDTRVKDQGGPELKVFTPKEGTIGWMDSEMVVKGGANTNLIFPFLELAEQAEYIAANFILNGRPLFNEAAYKLLVNQGQQERADRFLYNKPETVLTMTLKGPGAVDPGRDRRLQRGLRRLVRGPGPVRDRWTTETRQRGRRGSAGGSRSTALATRLGRAAPFLPGLAMLVFLFLVPMAFMLVFSFWRTNQNFDLVPEWNLDNYIRFFTVPTYLRHVRQDPGHGQRGDRWSAWPSRCRSPTSWSATSAGAGSGSSCWRSSSRSGRATCCGSTPGRRSSASTGALNQLLHGRSA